MREEREGDRGKKRVKKEKKKKKVSWREKTVS
jgi:hypothetical protein